MWDLPAPVSSPQISPGRRRVLPGLSRRPTRQPNSPERANPTQAPEYTGTLHNPLCSPSKGYPNPLVCNVHIIMLPIPLCRMSGAATPSADPPSCVLPVPPWPSLPAFSSPEAPPLGNASRASEGGESALPLQNTKTSPGSKRHFSGPRNTQRS